MAQEESRTFALPDARVGEEYRTDIETVLRETYGLRLEADKHAIIQWLLKDGELAPGLALRTNGVLAGTPLRSSEGTYSVRLRVVDSATRTDDLLLSFVLPVKPGRLRLITIAAPRLVPIKNESVEAGRNENTAAGKILSSRSSEDQLAKSRLDSMAVSVMTPPPPIIEWAVPGLSNGGTIDPFTEAEQHLAVRVNDGSKSICLLYIRVRDENDVTVYEDKAYAVNYNNALQKLKVKLAKGRNTIKVTPYQKKDDKDCAADAKLESLKPLNDKELVATVVCADGECGKPAAADATKEAELSPFSGINTRAIVGIEQSGASSAASEQKPFLDFFFNTPLGRRKDRSENNPHFAIWGDIRLTSTAQQISGFISSTANVVGAVKGDKLNDIANSFDFKVGTEYQLNPDARNRLSFIVGFGASSPLTEPTSSAQIFTIPTDKSNSQTINFYKDYPEADPNGDPSRKYIAFVRPERDRFMRQYFAGLRFRSYHYDDKGKIENRFPSIFDVTFGQNAAVTGGHMHKFVMSFEGSYQLPLKSALYIFGSANLKFGGDRFVKTPYVLDLVADPKITLTSSGVVTTTRQLNRDSYRLGFGIDLVELFKPTKTDTKDK